MIKKSFFFLFFGVLLIFSGCSSNIDSKSISLKENSIIIKKVLKHQFNGPDQELVKLLNDPENATIIGENTETSVTKTPTKLDSYLEKQYKHYFTEEMYSQFISKFALSYQGLANGKGYEIKIDKIDITQDKDNVQSYYFTANVDYQNEGSGKNETAIKGNVHFSDEGKISKFELLSDGGLSEKMNR